MKLSDNDINAIVAYWGKLLKQTAGTKIASHTITTFLDTLKMGLTEFSVDSIPLKVCIGVRKFIPEKSLFAEIFNYARLVSGIPMGSFAYGASMTVNPDDTIIVNDGFYMASYRYTPSNLTAVVDLKPSEYNPISIDVANQNISPKPNVKKSNSNKRNMHFEQPSWDIRESKYMRPSSAQAAFFSTSKLSPPPATPILQSSNNSNSFDLEDLFDIKESEKSELSFRF